MPAVDLLLYRLFNTVPLTACHGHGQGHLAARVHSRHVAAARFEALVAGVSGGPSGRLQRGRRPRGRVAVGTAVAVLRPLVRGMALSGESGHEREHDFLSDKKKPTHRNGGQAWGWG